MNTPSRQVNINIDQNNYKVLLVVEAAGNGISTQVVAFHDIRNAEECVEQVNDRGAFSTGVSGQLVNAVRLYKPL